MMPTASGMGGDTNRFRNLQSQAFQVSGGAMGQQAPQAPQLPSPPPGGWQVMNSGGVRNTSAPQAPSQPNMNVWANKNAGLTAGLGTTPQAPSPPPGGWRPFPEVMDATPEQEARMRANWERVYGPPPQATSPAPQTAVPFRPTINPGVMRSDATGPNVDYLREQYMRQQEEFLRQQSTLPQADPRRNLQPPAMPTPRPMPQNPGMAQPVPQPSQGTPYTPPEIRRPAQTWTQALRADDARRSLPPPAQPWSDDMLRQFLPQRTPTPPQPNGFATPPFFEDPITGRRIPNQVAPPPFAPPSFGPATRPRDPRQEGPAFPRGVVNPNTGEILFSQPQFTAQFGNPFGGPPSSTPSFAQRDALIQRLNDTLLPYQMGQRTGAPQFNIPQLFGQANQMVASGWRNPFTMR